MRYILFFLLSVAIPTFVGAQTVTPSDSVLQNVSPNDSIKTVYCLLVGKNTNLMGFGSKCVVEVDFGEGQNVWRGGMDNTLVDQDGKPIKFNSMIDALNFMTSFGWEFVNAYAVTVSANNHVYHWLLKKNVPIGENGREGLHQVRDKKKKQKKGHNPSKHDDPLYN